LASNITYKIEINNWEKHNGKIKKGHTHFLVSKRLFNDQKVSKLTPIEFQLFIYLLTISADSVSNEFEISVQSVPRYFRIGAKMLSKCLTSLQSNQILSYEKIDPFINRIEENRIEENRIEKKLLADEKTSASELNKKIWEGYKTAYLSRWKKEPIRNAKVNKNISELGKRLGEDAVQVVNFYVFHNDGFYIKKAHDIGLCLKDAESLHTQWFNGKQITSTSIRNFEKSQTMNETLERIERDGI
jgi:hypothetical protein